MKITTFADSVGLIVEHLRREFVRSGNPLYAWRAYRVTRNRAFGEPLPIPPWVAEYLDGCAEALLTGTKAPDALKLTTPGGGHSKHRQLADRDRNSELVSYIEFLIQADDAEVDRLCGPRLRGESKLAQVCKFVAQATKDRRNQFGVELPLSAATIENIYGERKKKARKPK
jgi:hypothetical protein